MKLSYPGTEGRIIILVVGNRAPEPDETFTVHLSNPTNATITDDTGTGTILNDDCRLIDVTSGPQRVEERSRQARWIGVRQCADRLLHSDAVIEESRLPRACHPGQA